MDTVGECHMRELKMAQPWIGSVAVSMGLNTPKERIGEFRTLSTEMTKPVAEGHTKQYGEGASV